MPWWNRNPKHEEGAVRDCRRCGVVFPTAEFLQSKRTGKLGSYCKPCKNTIETARRAKKRLADPVGYKVKNRLSNNKRRDKMRSWCLRDRYGISPEEFLEIAERGGWHCEICHQPLQIGERGGDLLHLDHCHETGQARGILCTKCNNGIGLLGDKASSVRAAYEYLFRHESGAAYEPQKSPQENDLRWSVQ